MKPNPIACSLASLRSIVAALKWSKMREVIAISPFVTLPILSSATVGEDWLQFRGPDATSISLASNPPIEFASENSSNIAWKVGLPGRSAGGVIVVQGQVISTSSDGLDQRRMYITSLSADSGERRWQQSFVARGRPYSHPFSSNAAPTPASDGHRIYAFYSSNDLVCLDLEGKLVWYRSLATEFPKAGNDTGMSSSPLVMDGVVVVQIENQGDSFVAGLEAASGELLWRIDRPRKANWNSPTPLTYRDGRKCAVLISGEDITAIEAKTGKEVFRIAQGGSKIPSALAWRDRLIVASEGTTVFDLASTEPTPKKLWSNNKVESGNASPIVIEDALVAIKGSVLSVGDVRDGTLRYKLRLRDVDSIWSTPVYCHDRLYVFSENGTCFVIQLGATSAEIVATNKIEDTVLGSPAVSDHALYVRGDRALWKIAKR